MAKEKTGRKSKAAAEPEEKEKPAPAATDEAKPEGKPTDVRSQSGDNLLKNLYFGLAEKSFTESPYHVASMLRPYNPDDLVQKSTDYAIYEDMMKDDQVSICLKIKKDLVLSSGWDLITEGDDDMDTDVKEFLETSLREHTEGVFEDMLEEILSAYEFGFSLTEKVFKKRDDGMLHLKYLRTRHPATWLIHTDEQGKIEKYEQLVKNKPTVINPKALIHYVNQPRFQNPYGNSDLRTAYNAWFAKRHVMRHFAMFLEKAAGPIPVAKYKTNAPTAAVDAIHNAIKSFQAKTALTIPADIEVEFLEAKNAGDAYHAALNIFNMFIGRSMFIPDLLGFQGGETGGGSYSLGQDQIKVFFRHVQNRRERLERIVNQDIIRPIVLFNFGEMEKYPKFKLRPLRDEDAVEFAKLWLEAVKGKVYKPSEEEINHFRKLSKFPEGDVEYIEQPAPGAEIDPKTGKPVPPKPGEEPAVEGEKPGKPGAAPAPEEKEEEEPKKKADMAARLHDDTPGFYSKKVDFKAVETAMDRFKNRVLDQSEPVLRKIVKDLGEQIKRKRILETQNAEKLEALKIKHLAELRKIIKSNMVEAHRDAKQMAARELLKGSNYAAPLPDEKFLDVLEAEIAQFTDDAAFKLTRAIRTQLLAAIKDGIPLSSVLNDLDIAGTEDLSVAIERFSRTKFTEVMNRGRLEFFNESGVVAAYQYSAVLDDRTSDICSGLHGKIFAAGTEPIPPMHFNCRSLLVPITKFEEFQVDKKVGSQNIDDFIEKNKGEGFARYTAAAARAKEEAEAVSAPVFDLKRPGAAVEKRPVDDVTDVYVYTLHGKAIREVVIGYADATKKTEVSWKTREVRDEAGL